jgi:hypothetical protein
MPDMLQAEHLKIRSLYVLLLPRIISRNYGHINLT